MATMDIGGDDSVAWAVTHDRPLQEEKDQPKRTLHVKHPNDDATNLRRGDRYVEGRDPSNTAGRSFTITIKLPKAGSAAFQAAVQSAANSPTGGKISFTLPIEDKNYDQIRIEW